MTTEPHAAQIMKAHQYLYYVAGTPVWSDYEYDKFCRDMKLDGKGGSDLESSYTDEDRILAKAFVAGESGIEPMTTEMPAIHWLFRLKDVKKQYCLSDRLDKIYDSVEEAMKDRGLPLYAASSFSITQEMLEARTLKPELKWGVTQHPRTL
jgi:hypothetical protein